MKSIPACSKSFERNSKVQTLLKVQKTSLLKSFRWFYPKQKLIIDFRVIEPKKEFLYSEFKQRLKG